MSKAHKCDRCGKFFTYDPDITSKKHNLWIESNRELDFCRECTDSLDIWFEAGKSGKEETKCSEYLTM